MARKYVSKVRRTLRRAYNSKTGKAIRKITGDRYGRGTSQIISKGLPQLYKDVMAIKNVINVEKKVYESKFGFSDQGVGQVDVNANGYVVADITPIPAEGTTYTTRNGRSIKLSGLVIRGQVRQEDNLSSTMKIKMYIIMNKNLTATVNSTLVDQFLNVDPITGLTDFNSVRNPNYYNDFKVIAKKIITLPADNYASTISLKDFQFNLKLRHHIRFNDDSTSVLNGQMWCLFVANTGNRSFVTASTTSNIANTAIKTGAHLNANFKYFFIDN